eukprot:TRINITY_DN3038_c0_g1_i2.p1 TRINITY_DN3038_c0_g1~~TRINITY_DN3038_c0_g1_i2.p1  ORF type:complete len:308 (-),score=110.30 TRINITY_DN3038_c0_g1_i2:168-1016(-)
MGSGASQEVSAKVKDNSDEDLDTLFKELPSDEVEKILKAAQAARGAAGSGETSAPFLRKAFKLIADCMGKVMEAGEKGEAPPEIDEEKLKAEYFALIKQSFDHHDRKKAGKLDKDDAAIFFKNFMQECMVFMEASMAKTIKVKIDAFKKRLEEDCMMNKDEFHTAKDHLPGALKAAQAEVNKAILLLQAKAKGNTDAFAANKDAVTCVAFAGTDDDGDGSLTFEEFKDMMDIGSDKYEKLVKLLAGADFDTDLQGGEDFDKALDAAKEAAAIYLKEKLGVKD